MTTLLTEDEVAARLKCSIRTVQRRHIPHVKDGRLKRYRHEDVEAYLCGKLVKPQEEQASNPSSGEKPARRIGKPAARSRFGRRMVQSALDELSEALAVNARLRETGKRSARSGTLNTRRDLETLES
jgi:excisionase family DNA binding protein